MPVVVTTADGALGRRLVLRLLEEGGEVRAYGTGRGDTADLRSRGAVVATGDLDDEGKLDAAMTDAHTVVHAVHGALEPAAEPIETAARTVLAAAVSAGVKRVIMLSVPGAAPDADDPLRRTAGRIESALRAADLPTLAVRTSLIDEPRLRDAFATREPDGGRRDLRVAPVRTDDLVEGLVALDAARSEATTGHAVFLADGPSMTLAQYLARTGVTTESMVGRVWTPPDQVPLLWASLDRPWVSDDPVAADLWEFAGVSPAAPGT